MDLGLELGALVVGDVEGRLGVGLGKEAQGRGLAIAAVAYRAEAPPRRGTLAGPGFLLLPRYTGLTKW